VVFQPDRCFTTSAMLMALVVVQVRVLVVV
jgi:hypothetical protein